MKTTKKMTALLLSFAMILTLFTATGTKEAQAADTKESISVTLRVEDVNKTLVSSTKITLSQEDLKKAKETYFTLPTETASTEEGSVEPTAAYALAQYIMSISNEPATDLTFSSYGNPLHIVGEAGISGAYWSYRVNNTSPSDPATGYGYNLDQCPIKDGDSIVIFRQTCYDAVNYKYTDYSFFDKDSYTTDVDNSVTVCLMKDYYDDNYALVQDNAAGETITAYKDGSSVGTFTTDTSGNVILSFKKAGTYTLVAARQDQGLSVLSRAFATVTVTEAAKPSASPAVTPSATPSVTPSATPTVTPSAAPSVTPSVTPSAAPSVTPSVAPSAADKIIKPDAPKKFSAKVNGKKIILSWKKVSSADKYVIYISKEKNKKFKTLKKTKRTKYTKKMKKGTYYIKVKSAKKINGKMYYSSFSSKAKITIK